MTLEVNDATVRFGGVTALSGASVRLDRGQILAVVGPNGSGKSTMFNAVTGMVTLSGGSVALDGDRIDALPAHARVRRGVARTFQTPRFNPRVTVEEAVLCGFYPNRRAGMLGSMLRLPGPSREEAHFRERCTAILKDMRLFEFSHAPMSELPMGKVRLVEVARAVANEPKYILLDEPAAGLARDEQQMLAYEIRRLAQANVGVLLVEHNFSLIRDLAENVVVLKDGAVLMAGRTEEVARDRAFIDIYLGGSGT